MEVTALQTPLDPPTSVFRRIWAVAASSVLAIWVGAVAATVIGFGVAFLVITLTHMLKR